jgi:alpha-L-arabinofuranosidase
VEGRDLGNRYQRKKTIGRVEDRTVMINRWNTEFARRSSPDYFQSFGLGFFEYFQLAEDIGAEPAAINSLDSPMAVSPAESTIHCRGKMMTQNVGAYTFCVIRIKI